MNWKFFFLTFAGLAIAYGLLRLVQLIVSAI